MIDLFYNSTAGAVLFAVLILGYALYRAALPRPIPGTPYHKASSKRILGDAPDMIKYASKHQTVQDWWTSQGTALNSPIFQLFVKPLSKPSVYVLDPRETQDVLLRRSKDFDRSNFFRDLFSGTIPNNHIVQPTNNKWKNGRRLLSETMGAGFLHGVAAPSLHRHALKLMELWRVKNNLAAGHAFAVAEDLNCFALDSIWDVALGSQLNSIGDDTEHLLNMPKSNIQVPKSADQPISFPELHGTPDVRAMKTITGALDKIITSPMPAQAHWFLRKTPTYRRAAARKNELVQESLDDAKSRLLNKNEKSDEESSEFDGITCGTDYMVRRESKAAAKEGRAPQYDSKEAKDELFGFLVGGHDTTATTLSGMVKLFSDNPRVQTKLRDILAAELQETWTSGVPTAEQIIKLSTPYLDAVIEEGTRHANTAGVTVRTAVHDTQLLGYHIPKGVDVYFMSNGPGYIAPNDLNEKIPESVRSASSRENKSNVIPNWDPADIAQFKPERWLKTDSDGREYVDVKAGPNRQFGGGVRGCFGVRLAYVEMRILTVVLLWTYELLPVPKDLASYKVMDLLTHKPQQCYLTLKEMGKAELN